MPKYYSPNLVQIPTCHGSLACDYDSERRGSGGRGRGRHTAAMLIKKAELRGDGRPRRRSARVRIVTELPVDPVKRRGGVKNGDLMEHLRGVEGV